MSFHFLFNQQSTVSGGNPSLPPWAVGVWNSSVWAANVWNAMSYTAASVPGAPTGATAYAGNALADVYFTAPSSNGGSEVLDYTVTSSPGGLTATGATSPLHVTGLSNGTAYTFTVTARNKMGSGSASSASNSATPSGGSNQFVSTNISSDGTNLTVAFDTTNTDLSSGVAGFGYSVGVGVPINSWVDVAGAVLHQSIVVSLVDIGAVVGNTVNIDMGYSLTNPAGTKVYASDYGVALTTLTV
jgi:large repetitive protein